MFSLRNKATGILLSVGFEAFLTTCVQAVGMHRYSQLEGSVVFAHYLHLSFQRGVSLLWGWFLGSRRFK